MISKTSISGSQRRGGFFRTAVKHFPRNTIRGNFHISEVCIDTEHRIPSRKRRDVHWNDSFVPRQIRRFSGGLGLTNLMLQYAPVSLIAVYSIQCKCVRSHSRSSLATHTTYYYSSGCCICNAMVFEHIPILEGKT